MKTSCRISFLVFVLAMASNGQAQNKLQDFKNPPNAARPRVWWHWMNGNISKEGIQKDLDWMTRVGIGGFQNFDANLFTPVVVPKKLVFMTPEWKDAFKFTTELANKKGLEMAIAGSPGWSVTGGPWVEPKDGMKKYVWTETIIEGGKPFAGKLAQPTGILSSFQNVALAEGGVMGGFVGKNPTFYEDAAVIAFKNPASEKLLSSLKPKVSSSGGVFNLTSLTDGDLNTSTYLPPKTVGEDMWIQYEFESPQTFKSLSVVGADHNQLEQFTGSVENRSLKVSDDGINFREVTKIHGSLVPQTTVDFASTTAKYFRFVYKTLDNKPNGIAALFGGGGDTAPKGVNVAEFVLYTTNRVNKFEDKAGFMAWQETSLIKTSNLDAVNTDEIIDISNKMSADGTLNWTPPAKNGETWTVIRFGYSLTGRQNHPASPEATGLEVDKLDKVAVKNYINTYLDMYKDATGGLMGKTGLQYMILDSYEAGHMNWTKEFPTEFKKRRGYDPLLWIPVLAGRYVKNGEATEKFLWDFRKTIGELIAENHYDVIGQELNKRGMKRYTESHENGRIYLADGMDVKRNSEIPMSAMWTPGSLAGGDTEEARSEGDIRESASVANIYGQNIVAAESMTSIQNAFSFHPEKLKRTADLEMASGLNRFVVHTSVHQPLDDKMPGFSLGPFGQYFTRQETWAEQAKAWTDYLARSCYMLQQGKNVADLLYYYGENNNITALCKEKLPSIPAGYEFDFVNATALSDAIAVIDGKLVAKSGNAYSLLVLDQSAKYMTLKALKRLQKLVNIGAKVVGQKPEQSPSLGDSQTEFQTLVNEIWANKNVFKGSIAEALNTLKIREDIVVKNTTNKILYRHRKDVETDLYWLNNRSQEATNAEISFNVTGKAPELWNPQTGISQKVGYQIKDGRTVVSLHFESWDAFFIVFKDKTTTNSLTIKKQTEKEILTLTKPWNVSFQTNRGAPEQAEFTALKSLTENPDSGIKYFSGTSTYQTTFDIQTPITGAVVLDLGEVKNIAEITVNGNPLGIVWKKPFKVDLINSLKTGSNTIEIKVTNLWVNRLIGDAQPGVKDKITFTTMPFYRADSPLLPAGLLGPVRILVRE